ncbi:MAG TPA: ABC transporter permease, partial [Stellaceae bacterium]|nr:ABC transporter permease [Stellaceae bacterium]
MTALDPTIALAEKAPPPAETPLKRFLLDFAESRIAMAGLVVFVLILLVAVFAPYVSPQNPYDLATLDLMDGR